jgi:PIN domain nuclease of toxin-antitoxin system
MANLEEAILEGGFAGMPVTLRHGELAGSLPPHHKDPFDRVLIAQAQVERLTLISNERLFDRYGVARLW